MTRPFALLAALCAALLLTACGGSETAATADGTAAAPQQSYQWKMVTSWPKNYPGLGIGPENFAKMVDEMSNGRLKIKVYGAGQLVPALEVFDAVSQGTAEIGHSGAYYWKGKTSAAPFFGTVPFGLNAQEMNGWVQYGGGWELWREIYEPFNLVPYPGGNTGVQMAGWFNKEINSIADIKGLKMRIPGLGGEVWTRAGGEAINLPGGEIYTSLQTGVIDATEWVGPYNDLAFGLYQIAEYYYYPGWHEPGPMLEFIVNKDALAALPADLQAIIKAAALAVNDSMLAEYTGNNGRAMKTLVEEHNVQLRRLPDDVLEAFRQQMVEIHQEMSAKDPDYKRVYESMSAYQQQVRKFHDVSERAYYELP